MKKTASNSKLSTPSKFVRRVLSRASSASRSIQDESCKKHGNEKKGAKNFEEMKPEKDQESFEKEIASLREQVSSLQIVISSMQNDIEQKEKSLTELEKDKHQLQVDLKREKRSTLNLKQQLEDERQFYYKEKEQYCQEMNDYKKLRKKLIEERKIDLSKVESGEIMTSKVQIAKLKNALNQSLEANYNLSVKFLRMKNTKISLKNCLQKQKSEHEKAMKNMQTNIDSIKEQIADVIDKKFKLPISPSNKKYMQIIKQNGMLLHENLCLQIEVDHLNSKLSNVIYNNQRKDCKTQLKLIDSSEKNDEKISTSNLKPTCSKSAEKDVRTKSSEILKKSKSRKALNTKNTKDDQNANLEKAKLDLGNNIKDEGVVKIFERNEMEGVPSIVVLSEMKEQTKNDNEKDNDEKNEANIATNSEKELQMILPFVSQKKSIVGTEKSDVSSTKSSTTSGTVICTQSAPEIVQTSLFVTNHKQ